MSVGHGTELFIGTSGYSYPDWKGVVYPASLKKAVGGPVPELTYLGTAQEREIYVRLGD